MSEKICEAIILQAALDGQDEGMSLPMHFSVARNVNEAFNRIQTATKIVNRVRRSFFIICPDDSAMNELPDYTKFVETPLVLSIFKVIDGRGDRRAPNGKIYHVPRPLLEIVISLMFIHHLNNEIQDERRLGRQDLVEIYLKNSETTRNWLIGNIRVSARRLVRF